jgi:diacylglycerol kinase family enzyme
MTTGPGGGGTAVRDHAKAELSGRVIAVLNLGSGGGDAQASGKIETIFKDAGLTGAEVFAVEPAQLIAALDDAVARADVVVVLGGDGTIRAAAARCCAAGKLLIPLPGGTMNMLSRALYGERNWEQALADTLADPTAHTISGGLAEGEAFFCAAILGAPTLWADAREALRHGDLIGATKRTITAIRRSRDRPLRYQFGDQASGTAEAVAVICPLVSRGLADDASDLEAAAVDQHATAVAFFRLAFYAIFDDWRRDPGVRRTNVRKIRITGHGRVPVILDGEKARLGRNVTITFVPNAFRALLPAGQVAGALSSL